MSAGDEVVTDWPALVPQEAKREIARERFTEDLPPSDPDADLLALGLYAYAHRYLIKSADPECVFEHWRRAGMVMRDEFRERARAVRYAMREELARGRR